ncbi:MAG: hypothetical protein QXS29_10790 [Nitrososphaeria archaeon]
MIIEEFCREVLKHSYEQERKNIRAAEIALVLLEAGYEVLPANVNQGYLLYRVRFSREELIKFWGELLEHTQGLSPTTKQIQEKLYYRLQNTETRIPRRISKLSAILLKGRRTKNLRHRQGDFLFGNLLLLNKNRTRKR